jgi:hypothetical protein
MLSAPSPSKRLPLALLFSLLLLAGLFLLIRQESALSVKPEASGPSQTQTPSPGPEQVACTMEAKLCSDGSYVGRTGPDCEFTPCPGDEGHQAWEKVKSALQQCQVAKVFQSHSLAVSATLKDGTELRAQEPAIDDIIELAQQAAGKCGQIPMATE